MNALRLLIALAILTVSCNNDRGPENDPNIKIKTSFKAVGAKPCGILGVSNKSCTFPAVVTENHDGYIKVHSTVSDEWTEDLWLKGPIKISPPSSGDSVLIFACTSAQQGKYVWDYYLY